MFKVIALFAAALYTTTPAAETLVFAAQPMENHETAAAQWKPMLGYLEKSLDVTLRIEYSTSYDEILDKFRNGKIDLAYLGPLPYITLKDKFPQATPVVHFKEKDGKASYTCAIIALTDARLTMKAIKGRTVALTQPLSTCGYFSTDGLLRQAGVSLEQNRYRYLDRHDEVALAVARGEFDAGGLKTAIGKKYTHLGLAVIAETDPLPGFALIANAARVDGARIARIRQVLESANTIMRGAWGDNARHGVVAAEDVDYAALRKLRGRADIPARGNF
ncbi:MAG: PhnD/SsuA/transferrin family substrate-binding protein [Sulfuricellaceae bacterium]|nr:PhnD/SsuA/transferrin family substrate-binding protein [Sulfuricellaceae bacterium]